MGNVPGSASSRGGVEQPPELQNSDEQLIGMGREIAPERRGLRTRAERGSRGAFYRARGGQNSSRRWSLMVAVPLHRNGHYGSLQGALRDGRGRGRRGSFVQVVSGCGEWERTGGRVSHWQGVPPPCDYKGTRSMCSECVGSTCKASWPRAA